jgi:hypothetical protein
MWWGFLLIFAIALLPGASVPIVPKTRVDPEEPDEEEEDEELRQLAKEADIDWLSSEVWRVAFCVPLCGNVVVRRMAARRLTRLAMRRRMRMRKLRRQITTLRGLPRLSNHDL